jgi:5-methyltetrahydrofolate--homocysteine methyltransferase
VAVANKHRFDTDILDTLAQRGVVGDGASGTQLQVADVTLDDFDNRSRRE